MGRVETRKRKPPARSSRASRDNVSAAAGSDSDHNDSSLKTSESEPEPDTVEPLSKRRRVSNKNNKKNKSNKPQRPWKDLLSTESQSAVQLPTIVPPSRIHTIDYHRPLLLDTREARDALLQWFDGVSTSRLMPWRKPWIDPQTWDADADSLRAALKRRAYEVWISEIMLQQTRVAVVIDYWKRWMSRWPTIQDLAGASPEDVLSAWRGLGYYSRATRIHKAAQLVVGDPYLQGLLPAEARELKAKVPGIGPYTAGAISAIVYGHPEAMVDGNVIRVLSRQMGLFADFKASKSATDMIWDTADALAKAVSVPTDLSTDARSMTDTSRSDRPGRWGQALMELGSTVCAPKPDCSNCPITSTCRTFAEGSLMGILSSAPGTHASFSTLDIEDMCVICHPMEGPGHVQGAAADIPPKKTSTRARKVASTRISSAVVSISDLLDDMDQSALSSIIDYAKRFPVKGVKKVVRKEESLVCAIRSGNSYLIQKRPSKGLLAGLWELPSFTVPAGNKSTAPSRRRMAQSFVSDLLKHLPRPNPKDKLQLKHVGELISIPWLFSHISLTMHVQIFDLEQCEHLSPLPKVDSRWGSHEEVEQETMGTGMRKCWDAVKLSGL